MRSLCAAATKVFLSLVSGLETPGDARTIDNSPGAFMAVHVDLLRLDSSGALYAVAHRFEQNGDLCPDPDVEFYVVEDPSSQDGKAVYPTAIDQPLGYGRYVDFNDAGVPDRVHPSRQADLAVFCNGWLRNIRAQQGLPLDKRPALGDLRG